LNPLANHLHNKTNCKLRTSDWRDL